MIETIPLDHILSLMIGLLFPLVSERAQKSSSSPFNRYFKRGLLFQIFVFFPIGLYLATLWPAWSWMYFINPEGKSLLTYLMVVDYIVIYCVGFVAGWGLIRRRKSKEVRLILGISAIVLLLLTFVPYKRILYVGGYEEFVDGFARHAFKYPEFQISMTIIGIYFFIPLILLLRKTYREALSV